MEGQINQKIVGATIIGFALVAGALTVRNFGESDFVEQPVTTVEKAPVERVAIAVTDEDNNSIEDWRDSFVTSETVVIPTSTTPYTYPDTLTGQTGVQFMAGIINSKIYAPIAPASEELVSGTVESLTKEVELKLLEPSDIVIMEEWEDEDVVNYANTVASVVFDHSDPNLENEIDLLSDFYRNETLERLPELESKALAYQNLLADTLQIPVPAVMAKEHLDLVNTYQAVADDVTAMIEVHNDPLLSLLYLKRYPEDVTGMRLALENIYDALNDYGSEFSTDDPAILFILFSSDYKP